MDDGHAFLPDPTEGEPARSPEELSETLAEEFVQAATSAEEASEDRRDEFATEEIGGPFLEATANEEFADDEDTANPKDATKEPFPTAIRVPRD
jgi:hypothetical protein